ncbi:hypothetical protein MMC17_001121 [Xylographa soralifera]|nr:hypothetical protein [Xylographa soralifera]
MVGTLPPGRPGNLTVEQQAKLQEFWKATLKVFGVPDLGGIDVGGSVNSSINGDNEGDPSEHASTLNPEKKSKRKGLFRRRKGDSGDKDDVSVHSSIPDADDKYGQTKEFQQALATQSPEELRKAFWSMVKHDHPDGLLLRFLRARKWDVEKALVMMVSTMQWRSHDMHVDDDIMYNGEAAAYKDATESTGSTKKEGEDFMKIMRLGKSFLHGCDKEGRPICVVRARLHRAGEQSEASLERVTVHIIETARLLLSPPVDSATIVFDMTGFSMANMDYAPVKFMIKCFEANYPESLGVVLVHKSPWVFQGKPLACVSSAVFHLSPISEGIWTIIKGWLDPVVASKVHFTKTTDELSHFISLTHIPTELGGDDPWTFSYPEPQPGENNRMKDGATRHRLLEERATVVKEFENATQKWIESAPQADIVVGQKRNSLAEQLRKGYWQLDPYLRARTWYDRTGIIKPGGTIEYYPNTNGTGEAHDPDGVD